MSDNNDDPILQRLIRRTILCGVALVAFFVLMVVLGHREPGRDETVRELNEQAAQDWNRIYEQYPAAHMTGEQAGDGLIGIGLGALILAVLILIISIRSSDQGARRWWWVLGPLLVVAYGLLVR